MTPKTPAGSGYSIDEHDIGGGDTRVRVRDYLPANRTARTAFVWVHGGGFAFGNIDMKESDAPARELAAAGTLVRTVEYRLAPRIGFWTEPNLAPHPGRYPEGLRDVVDAARNLAAAEGTAITLGGASAGANIAAGAALTLRDQGSEILRSLVLAYGAFHSVMPSDSPVEKDLRGPLVKWMFNPSMVRRIALNYVGDPALMVPSYAFPGGMDLSGLPPTLVMDASNDRLRASGAAFADDLRSAGVEMHETMVKGTHGFLGAPRSRKYADGMRELRAWLAQHD